VVLIGTGSEVALCVNAYEELKREGIAARVVSMPSWELFEQQDQAYRDGVLPPNIKARVSVEMGSVIGWDRYAGATGTRVGMTSFGASAPLKDLLAKFGFTPAQVAAAAKDQIAKHKGKTSALRTGRVARFPGSTILSRGRAKEANRARRADRCDL
jgi:transketolase